MVNSKPRYDGIDIHSALDSIASAFGFDADTLIDYAALDPHGGYHPREGGDGFPIGSIWRVEGQILYALVRAQMSTRTDRLFFRLLELGTHYGCSATHIAQAIHDGGGAGKLTCVDLNGAAGNMIPAHLLEYVEFVHGDMFAYLETQKPVAFDFILEDGSHGADDVAKVWNAAHTLLKPGGLILSHDAEHFVVGADVREGIARAGYFGLMPPARTYQVEPSDCGFAIWRKPFGGVSGDALVIEPAANVKRKNDELPTISSLLDAPVLSDMTVFELKAYADKRGIALAGARTKGAIIAAIEAAVLP